MENSMSDKTDKKEVKRRDFLGMSLAALAAVGTGASLVGMKQALDPLPSVMAAGFTTVDIAEAELTPGIPKTFTWRGKPVFILEKTEEMPKWDGDLVIADKRYTVVIGICTHLGCIPSWKTDRWKCACHGGEFNVNGQQIFGPPPKPFLVPPFKIEGTVLTFGEESSESIKLQNIRKA
jgi:ubiquinol-cytochrome c reductase iron-sulfur subunit